MIVCGVCGVCLCGVRLCGGMLLRVSVQCVWWVCECMVFDCVWSFVCMLWCVCVCVSGVSVRFVCGVFVSVVCVWGVCRVCVIGGCVWCVCGHCVVLCV